MKNQHMIRSKLVYIFLFSLVFQLFGQENLSVESCVQKALENNFQIQIAAQRQKIAEKNNKWSEAGLFPTVELTTQFGSSIIDNTNNPFTFVPGLIGTNQITPGGTVNWSLFSGGGIYMNKRRLAQLEEQSAGNALLLVENTIVDVMKAYYNAVQQEEVLEVLRKVHRLSKQQLDYEVAKDAYGQSNSLTLLQVRNQVFSDSLNVMQQKIARDNAYRNLLLLMNVPEEQLLSDEFPTLTAILDFPDFKLSTKELMDAVRANNQNLKNQWLNVELQKTNTAIQKSFLYPTIGFQAGLAPAYSSFRALADDNLNARTQQITYFANVNVRYTLFNNWKNKRALDVAKMQEQIATLTAEEMEQQIIVGAKELLQVYNLRSDLLKVAQQNLDFAEQAFDLGQDRYQLGQINSLELAQLQQSFINAKRDYSAIRLQRMESYLDLAQMAGMLQLVYKDESH
jgi:outer membrane protein